MVRTFLTLLFIFFLTIAFAQSKAEKLKVFWPPEYNWKVIWAENTSKRTFEYLIPKRDKPKSWTIIAVSSSLKKKPVENLDTTIKTLRTGLIKNFGDSRFAVLAKDSSEVSSWAIVKVEEMFDRDALRQVSVIYYMRQGKYNYFEASVRVKGREFPEGFVEKWLSVFKKSEIYYDF